MTTEWDASPDALEVGDHLLMNEKDTIEVTALEPIVMDGRTGRRVFGRIIKGWGRSQKIRSWTLYSDQKIDYTRG